MKDFDVKFRKIIIPFLVVAVLSNCLYTFLHWWLFIAHELLVIDEAIVNFAVPLAVSFFCSLIWLRPSLKLLDFTARKARNPATGYLLITVIAIGIPMMIAQEYLISASGKLTPLTDISQISSVPKTKYYTLKRLYIDKQQTRPNTIINTSGKYNVNYNMILYMPCPILDGRYAQQKPDTLKLLAWLGIKYQKTIRNSLSAEDKQRAFNRFTKESQDDFDTRDLTKFSYLDRIGPGRELKNYANAVTFSGVYNVPFIILVPKWGSYEDRNGNKGLWLIGSFIIGVLCFMLMIGVVPLKKQVINDGLPQFTSISCK